MRCLLATTGFILALSAASPCSAAMLEAIAGQVSVNRGTGFQHVSGVVNVEPGDAVMVSPGGSARVIYADGCPVNVAPGSVLRVAPASPCQAYAQVPGSNESTSTQSGSGNFTTFAIGAAAVGAVAGGAVLSTRRTNDRPASP
jgi:hypothetical protein